MSRFLISVLVCLLSASVAQDTSEPLRNAIKSKTAAEEKAWELARANKFKYSVCTIHPAVVLGPPLPGQPATSTMALANRLREGKIVPSLFGVCGTRRGKAVRRAASP